MKVLEFIMEILHFPISLETAQMAAIISNLPNNHKPGFCRVKKYSLRIDMTPMVDLGFLLITFFIFTSTISEPTSLNLVMPTDKGSPMPTRESGTITIIPAAGREVYYFEGFFDPVKKLKPVTIKAIRQILVNKKRYTATADLFVIIKPSKVSNYRNVVDVLDEMIISDIKRYALAKITAAEERSLSPE